MEHLLTDLISFNSYNFIIGAIITPVFKMKKRWHREVTELCKFSYTYISSKWWGWDMTKPVL